MKIFNKKSVGGFEWIFASIGLIIAFGIVAYGTFTASLPNIGERSLAVSKSLEGGLSIPLTVEEIMNQLNTEAKLSYETHKVFALDSYCKYTSTQKNTKYKDRLIASNPSFKTPKSGEPNYFTSREEVKCYAAEEEFMKYYEEAFGLEYKDFKSKTWKNLNLDFSPVDYSSQVVKEVDVAKKYFNLLKTTNGFTIPITMRDKKGAKNIGSFSVKPNFKIEVPNPANRPFDGHEVCIFASDCGATCHDVIEKYPSQNYKIMDDVASFGCDGYYSCTTPKDQFNEEYLCDPGKVLCQGACLPFCSSSNPAFIVDLDSTTKCKETSCNSYMSCGTISPTDKCGCPASSYACEGSNCDTLHCDSDPNANTVCKDNCAKYGDCSTPITPSCACDSGSSACQGSCYCKPQPPYTGSCGGETCSSNARPKYKNYDPPTCHNTEFLGCTACDPSCDPCDCNYEPACDCGGDLCCIEDKSLCIPEPVPAPTPTPIADNSCQGRCGQQAPDGCWCDNQCTGYGDCCSDYSQYCGS